MNRLIIALCVAILFGAVGRYTLSKPKVTNFIYTNGIQTEGVQFIKKYYKRG